MNSADKSIVKQKLSEGGFVRLIFFLLPGVLFYWMVPFFASLGLGTDYVNYHVYHQLDLLFSVKNGSFPLYAPACYYGQASVYPHAQLYHPLGYLASLMPGFWRGYSLEWLTLFRLISLAFCHFCLFCFLRRMSLDRLMAFVVSLITVYNLRMLDIFWNAVALEAYTGTLFLCAAIGCYFLKPNAWRGPLLIIVATYWLMTSDFPPMVFYGVTGALIFTLALPFLGRVPVYDVAKSDIRLALRFWGKTGLFCGTGALLSSAYLLPFFWDYMRNSSGRIDQPYLWSLQWTDTLAGFFNNFFFPLGSGFSMFGGSPLFLVAVGAPVVWLLRRGKVPVVVWVLLGLVILCSLYIQGDRTPVHGWAWQHLPLVSALRGPVRAALILPLLLMMILSWLAASSCGRDGSSPRASWGHPMPLTALIALVLTIIYFSLPAHLFANANYGCPCNLRPIPSWVRPVIAASSVSILLMLMIYPISGDKQKIVGTVLAVLTVLQLMVVLRHGSYAIVLKEKTPTYDQILAQKEAAINFQPVFFLNQHAGSRLVVRQLKHYFMEPDLAKIYRTYTLAADIEDVYKRLNNGRQPNEVVIENFLTAPPVASAWVDYDRTPDNVRLACSTYNRLVFEAEACQPGFFVLSYPYSGHWRAWLNGCRTATYRANGAAHAIYIPAGRHTIEFRYWSHAAFYGMAASCLTLGLLLF